MIVVRAIWRALVPMMVAFAWTTAVSGADSNSPDLKSKASAPREAFPNGEENFHRALRRLEQSYADQGWTRDDFYKAATQGLLDNLAPEEKSWNKLLTHAQLLIELGKKPAKQTGVGLVIDAVTSRGMAFIKEVRPDSAAQKAGLKPGDLIVTANGRSFVDKKPVDVTRVLRGSPGSRVELAILRDADVFHVKLQRDPLKPEPDTFEAEPFADGSAYVRINKFLTHEPPQDPVAYLKTLARRKPIGLMLDLRGSNCGTFAAALATTGLFLNPKTPLAKVRSRDGGEHTELAAGGRLFKPMPLSIIIDANTSEGCELMAAVLKRELGAKLVGHRTLGKWTIQTVEELPNHYGIKFTTATFAPSGAPVGPTGLDPDFPVESEAPIPAGEEMPITTEFVQDPQLDAAHHLLFHKM